MDGDLHLPKLRHHLFFDELAPLPGCLIIFFYEALKSNSKDGSTEEDDNVIPFELNLQLSINKALHL